ncbi:aldo/keto reductase [Salipiger pacificus]|nr:aldo/keto reductase [Alloyangia pacifica]
MTDFGHPNRRQILAGGAALAASGAITLGSGTRAHAATRALGIVEVFPVGLGCQWVRRDTPDEVNDFYSSILSKAEAEELVRRAVDRGVTLIDTAEAYGPLVSEEIVGKALSGVRDRVTIETKFGFDIDPETGAQLGGTNSRPAHVRRAVEAMLKRLRTDRIDVLIQHRVDPEVPIEDVAGVIGELMAEGKVLNWGLSEPGINTVRRAHAEQPLSVIQNQYSMNVRTPEAEVLPLCNELGIGLVCWSPLGMGFLSGKMGAGSRFPEGDFRAVVPMYAPENLPANMAIFELVKSWATRKSATPAQVALAWLMAQGPMVVPIPGTTNPAHLDENIGGADLTFSTEELEELNTALASIPVRGDRLPAGVLAGTGVEAPKPD